MDKRVVERVPYIIAEAGSCHEGMASRGRELVFIAARAGADAVKFQYWSSPERMRARRHVSDPQAYVSGSIRKSWFSVLQDLAHKRGLDFICTAYLPEDIPVVAKYVDAFKVSSFEATRGFISLFASYQKLTYVSTGMFQDARAVMKQSFLPRVINLHCVSAYPCPPEEANLAVLGDDGYGIYDFPGYSDHTRNVLTGAVAVGAGAKVLEVHFRLDDTSPNCPDYCVSLSPEELKQYIANARLAHVLMGDGVKRVMPSEEENVKHRVTVE